MSKRRSPRRSQTKPAESTGPRLSRGKLWTFRIIVLMAIPLALLLVVELVLRVAGFGHATNFFVKEETGEGTRLMQNNCFGWRFFGKRMARNPQPIWISEEKPPNTVRIFVFGESAAYGDPQPRFGLPRMIEALLGGRFPQTRFEVVNAAMTGINSHVILPIARDCAKANGDIWVVYMGNNEVVGPFGAGTVFGPQVPPRALIQASLALKATRLGQTLDRVREAIQRPPPGKGEWGGMTMFLEQQVAARDPRMQRVYENFEANLVDIIEAGTGSGAKVVVSTVAVNLRDAAPFASVQPRLDESAAAEFQNLFERGHEAHASGNHASALEQFTAALKLNDESAELFFRAGICALEVNQPDASRLLSKARDLDTLRFRCDSRLNEIIRRVATLLSGGTVALADAERAFADLSSRGVTDNQLFYEHVHLTFEGNYALAMTIVRQIEALLPERVRAAAAREWPDIDDCAARLGWNDLNRHTALSEMLTRLSDPPFTHQSTCLSESRRLSAELEALNPAQTLAGALNQTEAALAIAQEDPWLWLQAAMLRLQSRDAEGAARAASRHVALLPSNPEGWSQLGFAMAQREQFVDAEAAFRRAVVLDPQDVFALRSLAQVLVRMGRTKEAIAEYERAVEIKPGFGTAWLALGQLLESNGENDRAEECFEKALRHRVRSGPELATLARFCQARGWLEAAATNFADATLLKPSDASLRVEAGQNLEKLGRRDDATAYFRDAVRLDPNLVTARFLYGLGLGREGKSEAAVEQFQAAVRLMPELPEARLNLGMALMHLGRLREAATEFETVLRQEPEHPIARQQLQELRSRAGN